MPCDSVITNTVVIENVKDHDILLRALTPFGGVKVREGHLRFFVNGTAVDFKDGQLTSRLPAAQLGAVLDVVKQGYSHEIVEFSAERFGWSVEWDENDSSQFTINKNI
jgi:hypothetical protein